MEFSNDKDEKATIVIQSATGSMVFNTQQQLVKGFNQTTLNQIQPIAQEYTLYSLLIGVSAYL